MATGHVTLALLVLLVLIFSPVSLGFYLISDYYMDDGWLGSFGHVCGDMVGDDCAYINSHLIVLGITRYGDDLDCTVVLDAGSQWGARYKFDWKRFDLEDSTNCSSDSLTLYDGRVFDVSEDTPFGTFCGDRLPNTTGFPTKRFVTVKFKTDGGTSKMGFRFLATRTIPSPCPSDYFLCESEDRCIDSRLQCDGTVHCWDETDEHGCTGWEKFVGELLSLGRTDLLGVIGTFTILCTLVGVVTCWEKFLGELLSLGRTGLLGVIGTFIILCTLLDVVTCWEKFLGKLLSLGRTGLLGVIGTFVILCTVVGVLICLWRHRKTHRACLHHYCDSCCWGRCRTWIGGDGHGRGSRGSGYDAEGDVALIGMRNREPTIDVSGRPNEATTTRV